jgi:hypothetical protein
MRCQSGSVSSCRKEGQDILEDDLKSSSWKKHHVQEVGRKSDMKKKKQNHKRGDEVTPPIKTVSRGFYWVLKGLANTTPKEVKAKEDFDKKKSTPAHSQLLA